jgi:hypothetical protein
MRVAVLLVLINSAVIAAGHGLHLKAYYDARKRKALKKSKLTDDKVEDQPADPA